MGGKYRVIEKKLEFSRLFLVDAIPAYKPPTPVLLNGMVAAIFPL
jgi:hypothetical protein